MVTRRYTRTAGVKTVCPGETGTNGHLSYKEQRNRAIDRGIYKVKGMCLSLVFKIEETKKCPECYRVWVKRLIM